MLRFADPLALLGLAGLAVVAVAASRLERRGARPPARIAPRGARADPRRRVRVSPSRVLPYAAPALLILAIAGPQLRSGTARPTVLAVDESASVGAQARAIEGDWTGQAAADDCVSPCRVVAFAGAPRASPAGAPGEPAPDPGATDPQDAISAAIGLAPRGGRVVVLSVGAQTRGDLLATAAAARARQVEVDWVKLPAASARDAAITALAAPPAVRRGDTVPLTMTVHSNVAGAAVLRVRSDGAAPHSETIELRAGEHPLLLLYTAASAGWHSFQATISLPGDAEPANDTLTAVTDVLARPRVLVAGAPDSPLPALLSRSGLAVSSVRPGALPSGATGYGGFDAVVLDDVAAAQLRGAQIAALSGAVRAGGLGLLVIGGPHSFSLGGYATSALAPLLPVASLIPGNLQRSNVAVELVLDHSGSMIDPVNITGVPKIVMTQVAARESAAFLEAHDDQIGIVDFDSEPHTLVPLQRVSSTAAERHVDSIVDGLQANGGTNIVGGLQAGFDAILHSNAPQRHIILMTDGISQPEDYKPLMARLRRAHISVATVALGPFADTSLLAQIAAATGGNAYVTSNARALPKIFSKETQLSSKPARVTGRLSVAASGDSPVIRSLAGAALPPLRGNVVTTLKQGAQSDLVASGARSGADPALAEWQLGLGRVVAWTPGLGAPWAAGWLARGELWNDAVRWTDRAASPPALTPHAVPGTPGVLQIDLAGLGAAGLAVAAVDGTLTDARGVSVPVAFTPAGAGLLQADVSSLAPGAYGFALAPAGSGATAVSGEVALPYPAEYSPVAAEASPLGELVAQTGGVVLGADQERALALTTHALRPPLALLALVAFLAGVAVRLLPARPRGRGRRGRGRVAAAQPERARSSDSERALSSSSSSGSTDVGSAT